MYGHYSAFVPHSWSEVDWCGRANTWLASTLLIALLQLCLPTAKVVVQEILEASYLGFDVRAA